MRVTISIHGIRKMENSDFLSAKMRIQITIQNRSLQNLNMHDTPNEKKKSPQNVYKTRMFVHIAQHIMKCGINEPLLLNNKTKWSFVVRTKLSNERFPTVKYDILKIKCTQIQNNSYSRKQKFGKSKIRRSEQKADKLSCS